MIAAQIDFICIKNKKKKKNPFAMMENLRHIYCM